VVVARSLSLVREGLEGSATFLELLRVSALVWVVRERRPLVGLLDLLYRRLSRDPQEFIAVVLRHP